ncbi:MAG: Gx transporter family protein [Clostridiaceae bacterium]
MSENTVENRSEANAGKTKRLVLTGLFFAVALVLSIVESMLPPVPLPVPGVKFGLSNIAVMYALFFLSKGQAYTIAVLKAMFVLVTRGLIAAILSLFGGILSLTVMIVLLFLFKSRVSYLLLSIFGAVAHNIGQFIAITFIYAGLNLWAYLPVLAVSGVVAGIATATLLRFILPAFNRLVK